MPEYYAPVVQRRVAFDPAQLREGAKSTDRTGGCPAPDWEPHPNDFPDPCASWPLRPARWTLGRKAVE